MSMFNKKSAPLSVRAPAASPLLAPDSPVIDEPMLNAISYALARPVGGQSPEPPSDAGSLAGTAVLKPTAKPSVLSNGFEFEGVVRSEGVLNIASTLKGKVFAKTISLDVDGVIEGEIQAEVLNVKGKIFGVIHCQDLTVGSRALIDGHCFYRTLSIQTGGRISGKLTRVD